MGCFTRSAMVERLNHLVHMPRVKVAVAGYLVTVTFGAIFVIARLVAHQPQTVALGAALVMALPLAIAFAGDKIKSFKGFGIEVETKAASERVTEITLAVASDSADCLIADGANSSSVIGPAQDGSTGSIPTQVIKLINAPDSRIIELDLRDGEYWWVARLYLLSMLVADYTSVRRFVFTQEVAGVSVYVGMAVPTAVAEHIERTQPSIRGAYRAARSRAMAELGDTASAVRAVRAVELICTHWPREVEKAGLDEMGPDRVSRVWLEKMLHDDLRWAAIDISDLTDGPLLQYKVLTSPEDYTTLVKDRQLTRVVGKRRLAEAIATEYLTQRLNS